MSDSLTSTYSPPTAPSTALANRVRPAADDDDLLRTLGSWVESMDADLPDPATDLMPVTRIDVAPAQPHG